jgi:hypothetical protein
MGMVYSWVDYTPVKKTPREMDSRGGEIETFLIILWAWLPILPRSTRKRGSMKLSRLWTISDYPGHQYRSGEL